MNHFYSSLPLIAGLGLALGLAPAQRPAAPPARPSTPTPLTITVTATANTASRGASALAFSPYRPSAAPVATDDVALTANDTPVTFSLTANDIATSGIIADSTIDLDPATVGRQATFTITGEGTFSTVGAPSGAVTFTPSSAAFTGTASTPYTVFDTDTLLSNAATIRVHVGPRTAADASSGLFNIGTSVNVTTNDVDTNGLDVATVDLNIALAGQQTSVVVGGRGTFTVDNAGVVTFTPSGSFVGSTAVAYTVLDSTGAPSGIGTYTATLLNVAPVAVADTVNTPQATLIAIAVNDNDTDANGNATINGLTIDLDPGQVGQQTSVAVNPEGTFTVDSSGYVSFAPQAGFTGISSLAYTVQDAMGATSNPASIVVNVGPMAQYDASAIVYTGTVSLNVTTNDNDDNGVDVTTVDLDPTTAGIQTTFTVTGQGTFTVTPAGLVTFVPSGTYVGTTEVDYVVFDLLPRNRALSNVSIYSVTTTDVSPVAVNDSRNTAQATPTTFSVTNNDNDANGNATIDLASVDLNQSLPGIQDTLAVSGEGIFVADQLGNVTFTPVAGFTGVSVCGYSIQDNVGQASNVAHIAVNVGPLAVNDSALTTPNTAVTHSLIANDLDVSGVRANSVDLDRFSVGRQTTLTVAGQGTFTVNNLGSATFTPEAGFTGSSSVTYVVQDNSNAGSNPATLTVRIGPIATPDAATSAFGQPVSLAVGSNDTDTDGVDVSSVDLDPATAGIQASLTVSEGTFTVTPTTGEVTFNVNPLFAGGVVSIPYVVSDLGGAPSNAALLSVTVTPYVDVISTIAGTTSATAGQPVTYTVTTINNGPSATHSVIRTVQLPPNLLDTFGNPLSITAATYTASTGLLVYDAEATLAAGQTLSSTFSFQMPLAPTITATVSSTATTDDLTDANNNGSLPAASISTSTPLPVELVRFKAAVHGTSVRLTWATASEQNSRYFAVERSTDGRTFREIERVAAAGTSRILLSYTLTDAHPLTGLSYYRLRLVNTDATNTYSNISTVTFRAGPASPATVYPNPTTSDATLDLQLVGAGSYAVTVADMSGRQLLATTLISGLTHTLPVAGLPIGLYTIRLEGPEGQHQTLRLVRQ